MRNSVTRRVVLPLVLIATAAAGIWFWQNSGRIAPAQANSTAPRPASPAPSSVSCLGRVEPRDGIVTISARSLSGQASITGELRVREGDWVRKDQVLAILDSRPQLEAALHQMESQVAVAQQRLAVVKTGAKKGDLAVYQAEVSRLEAVLEGQKKDLTRAERLFQKQAATIVELDHARTAIAATTEMINAARSRITSLEEVRSADVDLAEAEVRAASAGVARAGAELDAAIIRAPFDARVVKVEAHPGEVVGTNGILKLARTDRMYVIAEVLDSDIGRVKAGMDATITGEAIKEPWRGKVEFVGYQVAKDNLAQTDPVSMTDARVVEVKVRLDYAPDAAQLIHGLVTVVIGH